MKHSAYLYKIIGITTVAFFLIPQAAFADSSTSVDVSNNGANSHTDVNVQSNTGGNTICQNGNCTTTGGGNGQSTVCINGQCQTSSGNIDMQSNDGNDQVHISNDTPSDSVTVAPSPTDEPTTISPDVSVSPELTITPDPTVTQLRRHINKEIKKQVKQIKEHVKSQDAALSSFIHSEMQSLQNLLNGFFK